jgi:hypothetical protein
MNHVTDDLPRLLTGEATRDEVLAAAAHLRSCDDCREELVSAVVAHASLTSAQRFAPEIMAAVAAGDDTPAPPLPDLSAIFETVRAEKAQADEQSARRGSWGRRRTLMAAGAVAAGVLIGSGVTVFLEHSDSAPEASTVALAPYDEGSVPAKVTLTDGDHMKIDASSLPTLKGQRYEVWLTDKARSRMQPVGWLDDEGHGSITVPTSLMGSYAAIEISRQNVNAPYAYSGHSVLRGTYS